jgi:protein DJ-1
MLDRCSRGVKITPDYPSVESTAAHTFVASADVLVLPGGARGAETFAVNNLVVAFVKAFMRSSHAPRKRWLAAICAATAVLVAAAPGGVGGGEDEPAFVPRVTSHPSVKGGIVDAGWAYGGQEERVVIDRNVITSRGPGTALAWALAIVEEVAGFDKRMEVQGPMMVAHVL